MELKPIKKIEAELEERAQEIGLMDNYVFRQTWNAYRDQLSVCAGLFMEIEGSGYMVMQTTRDGTKKVVNPAVSEYNRMAGLVNKTTTTLLKQISEAEKNYTPSEEADKL